MKIAVSTLGGATVVCALLLSTLPVRAVIVNLPPNSPEVPGVPMPPFASGSLQGFVVLDTTVSFSLAMNAYGTGSGGAAPVPICFRDTDQTVPAYLLPRYLAQPGSSVGPCPNPVPFALTGTLRFLSVDRGAGLRDFYFQIANTTPLSAGPGHDLFRMSVEGLGFGTEAIQVTYTNSLAALSGVAPGWVGGTVPPRTADRDVSAPGVLGFNFASAPPLAFLDDPGNVHPGDVSNFIVIRTNLLSPSPEEGEGLLAESAASDFPDFRVVISGAGTLDVRPLADVPEPGAGLLAAAGAWVLSTVRGRRR